MEGRRQIDASRQRARGDRQEAEGEGRLLPGERVSLAQCTESEMPTSPPGRTAYQGHRREVGAGDQDLV